MGQQDEEKNLFIQVAAWSLPASNEFEKHSSDNRFITSHIVCACKRAKTPPFLHCFVTLFFLIFFPLEGASLFLSRLFSVQEKGKHRDKTKIPAPGVRFLKTVFRCYTLEPRRARSDLALEPRKKWTKVRSRAP